MVSITAYEKSGLVYPDMEIYVALMDEEIKRVCYILPGLASAGNTIIGTKESIGNDMKLLLF